jgi:hypothetical protein
MAAEGRGMPGARNCEMNDLVAISPQLSDNPLAASPSAAIKTAGRRRPIVLVLGMHRSGTSLCTHVLSAMGIDMADDVGEGPSNTRGHWERWEIVDLHDRILELLNRSCYGPFHDFSLPEAWWADPRVFQIKQEIVAFLEKRMRRALFGFKDPRTARLMPLWHQISNDLNLAPKVVLCLRNPAQVARSLNARDGVILAHGEYRWLVHMTDVFRYTGPLDVCVVEYETWFEDFSINVNRLRRFLGFQRKGRTPYLDTALCGIIDPALRHDDPAHCQPGHPLVRSLYEVIRRLGQGDSGPQIDEILSRFSDFEQLERPFRNWLENVVGVATRIEQEAAGLREVVGQRNKLVEAATARACAAETGLEDARAEIRAQHVRLAEITRERDDRASALSQARAELASYRSTVADIEDKARALQARLADRERALA